MPAVEQLMDFGGWDLALDPAISNAILNDIDIRTRLWATYVHTAAHWDLGDLSDAELLGAARYTGILNRQGSDRQSLSGPGIGLWMGDSGDGGDLFSGADTTTSGLSLAGHLAARLTGQINGLTLGDINADATTFSHKREGGDTRWEILHTLVAMAPGGPYYFRINSNDFTIDVGSLSFLWSSTSVPTVILSAEAGLEADIVGLYAALDLREINGEEVRTGGDVDYADGVANGTANASLPATYGNLVDGSPDHRFYIDWRPHRNRPPTERWRRVAAWGIAAQARADIMAAREVNERSIVRPEWTASLPGLEDPWRYDITPGNTVFIDDVDRDAIDLTNEVYYRGEVATPTTGRVEEMTTPFTEGGGHYLRCWDGVSAFEWIDLTRYAVPEEGAVELKINHRTRLPVNARARRQTRRDRRQWMHRSHTDAHNARLQDFYDILLHPHR